MKLFDQAVLEQAKKLVAEGKFNDAFDYFGFLRHEYPKCVGLDDAISDFLYEEAKDWQRKRKYENALVLLHTLYGRQSQRPGLEAATAAATGKLLEKYYADNDYSSSRKLVRELRKQFPNGTTAARFEQQLNERAVQVVTEGREMLTAGNASRPWRCAACHGHLAKGGRGQGPGRGGVRRLSPCRRSGDQSLFTTGHGTDHRMVRKAHEPDPRARSL